MSSILESLSALIKALSDSLRLPSLFPALTFVVLNGVFIFPLFEAQLAASPHIDLELLKEPLTVSLIVLMLSYTLSAFEVSIVRIYEGYSWKSSPLGRILTVYYMESWYQLQQAKYQCEDACHESALLPHNALTNNKSAALKKRITELENILENHYPSAGNILPTKLGNLIANFEAYPNSRYGIDGIIFLSRMVPILTKNNYMHYIDNARATVDFLLNTSFILTIFAIQCAFMRIFIT